MLGVKKQRSEGSLPPPPPPAQRHVGYQCRGCTQSPILGIRHHSLKAVPADGTEIDFCSRCILGPLGQMYAQDHGPYFEEIYAPTGGAHARDVTGNQLFAMLTSEDLLDELLGQLGAGDLGRLECACHVFWQPQGKGAIELYAKREVEARAKPHTVRRPDKSSYKHLLAHMLHRPVLVLHGPASTATVAQPFLYPGQPTGGMIGKETARRAAAATIIAIGDPLGSMASDETDDSEEMRALNENHLRKSRADVLEALRGMEKTAMFGGGDDDANASSKRRLAHRRRGDDPSTVTSKTAVAQHHTPQRFGVRRDRWSPCPALRVTEGMLGLPRNPKLRSGSIGSPRLAGVPRLEFIPLDDGSGPNGKDTWSVQPVHTQAWVERGETTKHIAPCPNGGATANVVLDIGRCSLGTLIDKVLKAELGFRRPILFLGNNHIYTDREPPANIPGGYLERERRAAAFAKTLREYDVEPGSVIDVDDGVTSLMRRVAIHADTSHKYQIPLGDDGDETADDGQWFEMRPLLPNPNPPAPIRDGDTLLLPAPGAASAAAATAAAARVEFRWVAPSFRATDHWSDGLATEEEKREAAERGSGFGPASETWWLCQLQGLWLSKGTARVTVIRGELDALAQRRERLAVLDGGEAAPQPAQPAQPAQAQEQENHHHHAMEEEAQLAAGNAGADTPAGIQADQELTRELEAGWGKTAMANAARAGQAVDMCWTANDSSFLEAARRLRGLWELHQ